MSNNVNRKVFTEEEKQKIAPYIERMKSCGVAPKYFYENFLNIAESEAGDAILEIASNRTKLIESFFLPEQCLVLEGNGDVGRDLLSLLVRMCSLNGLGVRLFYSVQDFIQ